MPRVPRSPQSHILHPSGSGFGPRLHAHPNNRQRNGRTPKRRMKHTSEKKRKHERSGNLAAKLKLIYSRSGNRRARCYYTFGVCVVFAFSSSLLFHFSLRCVGAAVAKNVRILFFCVCVCVCTRRLRADTIYSLYILGMMAGARVCLCSRPKLCCN